jgi:hypothetical protein
MKALASAQEHVNVLGFFYFNNHDTIKRHTKEQNPPLLRRV